MTRDWIPRIEQAINEWALKTFPDLEERQISGVKARLPEDSTIHFRDHKQGLILVSPKKNIVLKIFLNPKDIGRIEGEAQTLALFQKSSFKEHVPQMISFDKTSNGAGWLLTDYCNHPSFENKKNVESYLLKNMDKYFYPVMKKLYVEHGNSVQYAKEWLKSVETRSRQHPSKKLIDALIKLTEKELDRFSEYRVVKAHIHHDIHKGNILSDGNKVTIIDWEGMVEGLVLIDALDFPQRVIKKSAFTQIAFFLYIKGFLKQPPKVIREFFLQFQKWMTDNFKVNVPNGSERLTFMLYVLERTLITYEGRKVDRLTNKKDFDVKFLKALGLKA